MKILKIPLSGLVFIIDIIKWYTVDSLQEDFFIVFVHIVHIYLLFPNEFHYYNKSYPLFRSENYYYVIYLVKQNQSVNVPHSSYITYLYFSFHGSPIQGWQLTKQPWIVFSLKLDSRQKLLFILELTMLVTKN